MQTLKSVIACGRRGLQNRFTLMVSSVDTLGSYVEVAVTGLIEAILLQAVIL